MRGVQPVPIYSLTDKETAVAQVFNELIGMHQLQGANNMTRCVLKSQLLMFLNVRC
jgi:hypothetical protein